MLLQACVAFVVLFAVQTGQRALKDGGALGSLPAGGVFQQANPQAPVRPLTDRGRDNMVAFTRLLGYVRFFHPSDEAARADWDAFTIAGIGAVEATDPRDLAETLQRLFAPVAPTLRVFTGGRSSTPSELKRSRAVRAIVTWKHRGLGLHADPVYASARVVTPVAEGTIPADAPDPGTPIVIELGAGVKASVPIALWSDGTGTLPRAAAAPAPPSPSASPPAATRATRLAAVATAWNVVQHFYPYFDVIGTDWPESLRATLTRAALDTDEDAFLWTLRRMIAQLHDGSGGVMPRSGLPPARLPVAWDWVENSLVITSPAPGDTSVRDGDVVVAIDERPASDAVAERERFVSGATPQRLRWRALSDLAAGRPGEEVALRVRTAGYAPRQVVMKRASSEPVTDERPAKVAELRPGIYYVDPERLTDQEFTAALPALANARGIVFDMRGIPAVAPVFIQHLIDQPVQSAQYLVPIVPRPDRAGMTFDGRERWSLTPRAPRLHAALAFVTDARAVGDAESWLGIVQQYKLGAIVGAPTGGTSGHVNSFAVPGGYTVMWTGLKVLKHDGSRHHGVGIPPTMPVSRTIKGVTEGRDELLERAIEAVNR